MKEPLKKRIGAVFGIHPVTRSIKVPRGHIQPQKNLPRTSVKAVMRRAGRRSRVKPFTAKT